ncbi:MAG: DNA mismatch repair protein, partial [Candidatus Magasanikbacteria bacterium CG10_big_fil_rev_8_21_14_0_10_38_6]
SGLYVPATTMRFSLCTELFTRIVAKDNFEKGLSSFAVEMVELKNIFNRCGSKSLILGDEISHGTETLSAIAIVGATIKRLVEKKSLFLFTTHLHQIHQCNILSEESSHVASAHMQVHYDKDADQLVFDRVLQAGNGSSIYGLEFAQSLHMDEPFLQYATTIRKSLTDDYSDIELLVKKERSIYNKHVYLSSCAICSQRVEDVHHIVPQKEADDAGNIGHFHKNHTYNLLPICKSCHKRIHDEEIQVNGFVMTSKGLQLLFEER